MSREFLERGVAGVLRDFEVRAGQVQMMDACARIVGEGGTLLAEAGTGTGKTFAYLIPVILSGKKSLVSTRTKNLQEQLVSKDLRLLAGIHPFTYAIAKGRSNYICLRRLRGLQGTDNGATEELKRLTQWASASESGDREDFAGPSRLWEDVSSDADACLANACSFYRECFYYRARKRWHDAQIIVTNHALLGINALLPGDSKLLPDTEVLIVDEGHTLDHAVTDVAGITLTSRYLEKVMNRLLRTDARGHYRGLLAQSPHFFQRIEALRSEAALLWISAKNEFRHRTAIRGDMRSGDIMMHLAQSMRSFITDVRASVTGLFKEDDEIELAGAMQKLSACADALETVPKEVSGFVRWIETDNDRITLRMSPVYPRELIQHSILGSHNAVIFTSATLSVSGDFRLIRDVLGITDAEAVAVPSPFDVSSQVEVSVRSGIDLNDPRGAEQLGQVIIKEAQKGDGGILVLFTSRDSMQRTWMLIAGPLRTLGRNPMIQGELPNRMMLDIMRETRDAVLFGLDSFWEGIDVKGDSLRCLIITKLPFEVPTEPIVMARTEEIANRGGNPFLEYSLPKAVLKFRQGFGRLIRSSDDRGRVVICDERIERKSYGPLFMKSIA